MDKKPLLKFILTDKLRGDSQNGLNKYSISKKHCPKYDIFKPVNWDCNEFNCDEYHCAESKTKCVNFDIIDVGNNL